MVADILVGEGEGCRGSWLIRGDAMIGVDLAAQILGKDDQARRATVRLPQPEVMQARVDHERTKTWQIKSDHLDTFVERPGQIARCRDASAQRLVAHAAGATESIQQAKAAAEAIIAAFYAEVGWQVKVTWASAPSEGEKAAPSSR